jgi:uncharacterized membrane protein
LTKALSTPKKNLSNAENDDDLTKIIEHQIGELVPQKQRDVIVARMTSLMVSESFSGPIAHPKHLKLYEDIAPGSAERIIAMAEKQQNHHINMDETIVKAEIGDRKLGMNIGAIGFSMLILSALVVAIVSQNEVLVGLFLGAAALGAISRFINGRDTKK